MKKLLLLLILSFFSTQGFTASCPDGSEPAKTVSADGTYFEYKCDADTSNSLGIDTYGDRFSMDGGTVSIPHNANPNYETLKYFLYKYLYYAPNCCDRFHTVKASNPYNFQFNLREDKYIKKQMQETALLSYLLYEDGKIVIDEITPNDRFGDMFTDSSIYHSRSMGKSITSYITGHAICEGKIESVDSRLDDWPILEDTLYHNQKLINLLNMSAGDSAYAENDDFISSTRKNVSVSGSSIQMMMKNEFKGSKKSYAQYNYNDANPNIVLTYLLYKYGDADFKRLLDDIFEKKVKIGDEIFLTKNGTARKDEKSLMHMFFTTRYDYLRIAKAMLDDWQNDTCVGQYLKTIHDRRISKGNRQGSGFRLSTPKGYAGFFHTSYKGLGNRPVMSMDGYGGQTITIDFERRRIIVTQAIHDNTFFPKPGSFDWKKIVYERIKNGKPASTSAVKQPIEPVIDPQQLILDNEARQEVEREAKTYWDNYYSKIFLGALAPKPLKSNKKVNPDGKKISKYQNGKTKSEEHYKDGKKEGKFTTWYQSGEIKSEINYKDDKREGLSTTWYQSGEIKSEIKYKNNSREGTGTSWYVNGKKKAETNYKNGKKEGKSTVWYQSGQKKSEANYKDNTTDGKRTMWYENGQKKSEGNYKAGNAGFTDISGLKEGKFTTWYENGQKKSEENYIDNKREGKRTMWYENGQVMYKDNFKDGKLDGKKTNWHENGQIKSEANYKNGELCINGC